MKNRYMMLAHETMKLHIKLESFLENFPIIFLSIHLFETKEVPLNGVCYIYVCAGQRGVTE